MNPSTPPKGSLEDLFRFHLLESEAAAVPPRPQVWEQVDNSLLLAQNEKYRRRLAAYRWAVAASLLLASLAGGGWWHSQRQAPAPGPLTQATTQPGSQPGLATARYAATGQPRASGQVATRAKTTHEAADTFSSTIHPSAIDQTATTLASAHSASPGSSTANRRPGHVPAGQLTSHSRAHSHGQREAKQYLLAGLTNAADVAAANGTRRAIPQGQSAFAGNTPSATTNQSASAALSASTALAQADSPSLAEEASRLSAAAPGSNAGAIAEDALDTRLAVLVPPTAALPASLVEVAVAPGPPLELVRSWQYGASYSASAYNPNIEWAKSPVLATANNPVGYSASFSRSVAAEYRDNLRAGLGQRLSLWATRRLGNGRWGLRTGLELSQNTATSASSVAFVGEPVADLSYLSATAAPPLQRTSYRYRSVSVPAELRYANPLKTGFSLYGRIGAMVTALLNVRSEVAGTPEATHTYSIASASTPYRRVSAGLRGGAGMQYRPAGHQWVLNFGPVVEMGLFSLDADPKQNFWSQQRPYSFGLEAGMEIGRGFRLQ